ncbi:MAG: YhcH/YjgK/YiaL family protein [Sideroxydans sp.]|nr:YhcH/YjgK/YiaL family protein [Sideroxydans sp.]
MIFATLPLFSRYLTLHPLFPAAYAYLRDTDLNALAPGVHQIIDQQLFVIVEHANGRTRAEAKLEAHRRYIDIQLVLAGLDEMGWQALSDCNQPIDEHNLERDIRFFDDAPATWIAVPPAHFCIFFPDDAHAPLVGSGAIRKVIMKVAVAAI